MTSNRVKLTKSFIDQLTFEPAIYRDTELIGFAVRVQKTYKTYIVEKKVNGRSVRHTIGICGQITLAQARIIAQERLLEMSQGINPNEQKKVALQDAEHDYQVKKLQPTLHDAYLVYLSERKLKPRTIKDYNQVMSNYLLDWQDKKLADITRKMIQDKHKFLSAKSKAQANMAMRVFRAIYNFSVEHYLDKGENPILPTSNPVKTLTAKKSWNVIKRRKTYIHEDKMPDWIQAVLNFKDRGQSLETNKDFLITLILTGFRRNECECIRWSEIDLKYGFITSIDPKNYEPHTLPMGDYLWALMKKRRKYVTGDWVFPSKKSKSGHIENISKVRKKINDLSGVQFTFHDLRRTFGSIAENLDYGKYTIKKLLNHSSDGGDVTAGYIQVNDKKIRQAMNEIEMIIFGDNRDNLIQTIKEA